MSIEFIFGVFAATTVFFIAKKVYRHPAVYDTIVAAVDRLCQYRAVNPWQGFACPEEIDGFIKRIGRLYTAVVLTSFYCDGIGWQYAEFKTVPLPSGQPPELKQAIALLARSFIQENHGIDNPDIFVIVLNEHFLKIAIACSYRAHCGAKKLHFVSPEQKRQNGLDEEV